MQDYETLPIFWIKECSSFYAAEIGTYESVEANQRYMNNSKNTHIYYMLYIIFNILYYIHISIDTRCTRADGLNLGVGNTSCLNRTALTTSPGCFPLCLGSPLFFFWGGRPGLEFVWPRTNISRGNMTSSRLLLVEGNAKLHCRTSWA